MFEIKMKIDGEWTLDWIGCADPDAVRFGTIEEAYNFINNEILGDNHYADLDPGDIDAFCIECGSRGTCIC